MAGKYFPYGQERPSATTDGTDKFATYFRDSETGLDYAQNRYHQPGMGRFMTPDPYGPSAKLIDPGSWNRYAYVGGDPVNRVDRQGKFYSDVGSDDGWDACSFDQDTCDFGTADINQYFADLAARVAQFCDSTPVAAFAETAHASLCGGVPTQTVQNPPPPSCDQALTLGLQGFLQNNDAALLSWDPTLAADLVAAGKAAGVDPRLMASIATLESGHGTTFGGTNNPFGLGPGNSYGSPQAAVGAEGSTLHKFIYTYGETSVSALYSGNGFIVDPKRPWIVIQYPAYCYGGKDGSQTAACQAAGNTISGFLTSQIGNPLAGLRPGNPNSLGYPCPQ
jgi:RHS repeat-associated protein